MEPVEPLPLGDFLPQLPLLPVQIGFRQLVDGLVQEGGAAHGRFAELQVQNLVSGPALQKLLQGVFHQAPGQRLRSVVGGGFFPPPSGQAVDEFPLLIPAELPPLLPGRVPDPLLLVVAGQLILGDEIARVQLVGAVLPALDLVQGVPGDEAPVGQQGFVGRAQLVDAQAGVGNAAPSPLPPPGRPGAAHQADDPQHGLVAQPGGLEHGGRLRVKDAGGQRGDDEGVV